MALEATDKQRLWRYREEASVSISTLSNVHKMDISLPIGQIDSFTKSLVAALESVPDVTKAVVFGHIAEGNLHIDVAGPAFDDFRVDEAVYRLAAEFGGSIASEHGVGRVKPHLLPMVRDTNYLEMLRRIKQAWDPDWLLNPGVLVLPD
jgi:FAD/FMN-containing dehydrogenase